MNHLPKRNNTNFPLAVLKTLENVPDGDGFLMRHQKMLVDYFTQYPEARGIVAMHETGTGKSIDAASIADEFIKQKRRVIMLAPKTLQNNMKGNIVKYKTGTTNMDEADVKKEIDKNYTFVSANANNMMEQLRRVSQPMGIQDVLDSEAGIIKERTTSDSISLEGTVVVIDEAHNLLNGIVSGSKNARSLYDTIMRTRDIKLLLLTSNVMVNSPFELVPCFNMLTGYNILPTSYDHFMDMFVDEKTGNAKNLDHFKARIFGLTSYYGSWFQTGGRLNIHLTVKREGLPTRLPIKEEFIKMSVNQYGSYLVARDDETRVKSFMTENTKALSKPSGSVGSTYRIKSRQLSNFWLKQEQLITEKMFQSLDVHSPKFAAMYKNITSFGNRHGMVYSTFVKTYGIHWFARVLELHGYTRYNPLDNSTTSGKAKRYAFITGEMTTDERSVVLDVFNSNENKDAEIIHLLLGSPAMSEGVDTKRIRHVHVMEAPWHFSAMDQIIARAVRYMSHDDLPENERTVQPFIYLADYPDGAKKRKEPTTDVDLYFKAIKKKIVNDSFFKAMIEASIDCSIHIKSASKIAKERINCMLCVPDNKRLFNPNVLEHLSSPSTCRKSVAKNIQVNEIKFAGRKFYYSKHDNKLLLYQFDKPTSSYITLPSSSKYYTPLFKKLTQNEGDIN